MFNNNTTRDLSALNQAISVLHDTFDDMGNNSGNYDLSDLDPDLNCISQSFSKYYLDHEFSSQFASDSVIRKGFSVLNLNIRSIPKNLESLTNYLHLLNFNFSVISITESWLNANNYSNYSIPNYSPHHVFRTNRRGGGVSIFLHSSYEFKPRLDLDICNDVIECGCIEILSSTQCRNPKTIIVAMYRPPGTNPDLFIENVNSLLNKVKSENKMCFVMGDFNLDFLKNDEDALAASFLELLQSFSYRALIDRPTRITSSSSSLIDNIFCNNLTSDILSGLLYTSISDHLPTFALLPTVNPLNNESKTITMHDLSPNNKVRFTELLSNEDWADLYQCTDAERAFHLFISKFKSFYDNAFPVVTRTLNPKRSKPWLTRALQTSIRLKNKLYVKFHKQPTTANEIRYKAYKYQLERILIQAKKQYYQNLLSINRNNPCKTWKILRELIGAGGKEQELTKITCNGHASTDKLDIANQLNTHFTSIALNLSEQIPCMNISPTSYLDGNHMNSIYFAPVQPNDVNNCILHLKINSASGHDGINPRIVKDNSQYIVHPLTYVINLSLSQSFVPDEWKIAYVTPIFKAGERDNMSNYRPISVLPVFSKILERIVYNKLYNYLNGNSILSNHQFGFRSGHSTEMPLTIALDRITHALDRRQHVISIFLDLQKAFDMVDHSILLKKLEHYGVRGVSLGWFNSYLTNRRQIVKLNSVMSDCQPIVCGVPQGSILGPLLFLIFINDICNLPMNLYPLLFADDTTLLYANANIDDLISTVNNDLDVLSKWFKSNRLLLNINKTNFMFFSLNAMLHRNDFPIEIDNTPIHRVSETKFLGVFIDSKLTWSSHIIHTSKKVSKSIGILNKLKNILDEPTLLNFYNSLVHPYLMYCHIIWGKCSSTNMKKLIVLQKKSVRIITNSVFLAHTDPLFSRLKILKVQDLFNYLCCILIFKLIHDQCPHSFSSAINLHRVSHNVNTRSNLRKYFVPFCRTTMKQRSLAYVLPKLCNEFFLPFDLNSCTSITQLKKK